MPSPIWNTISGMANRPVSSDRIGAMTAARAISTRVATEETSHRPAGAETIGHRITLGGSPGANGNRRGAPVDVLGQTWAVHRGHCRGGTIAPAQPPC